MNLAPDPGGDPRECPRGDAGYEASRADPIDRPIRVVIQEGVKYGISRKRAKLGGDKYRQAHVGLFLSNAAEGVALKMVEHEARMAKRDRQNQRLKARADDEILSGGAG